MYLINFRKMLQNFDPSIYKIKILNMLILHPYSFTIFLILFFRPAKHRQIQIQKQFQNLLITVFWNSMRYCWKNNFIYRLAHIINTTFIKYVFLILYLLPKIVEFFSTLILILAFNVWLWIVNDVVKPNWKK